MRFQQPDVKNVDPRDIIGVVGQAVPSGVSKTRVEHFKDMLERHPDWKGPYTLKEISALIEKQEPRVWEGVFHAFPWRICGTLADLRGLSVVLAGKHPDNNKDMVYTVLPKNLWETP